MEATSWYSRSTKKLGSPAILICALGRKSAGQCWLWSSKRSTCCTSACTRRTRSPHVSSAPTITRILLRGVLTTTVRVSEDGFGLQDVGRKSEEEEAGGMGRGGRGRSGMGREGRGGSMRRLEVVAAAETDARPGEEMRSRYSSESLCRRDWWRAGGASPSWCCMSSSSTSSSPSTPAVRRKSMRRRRSLSGSSPDAGST
mmetsp:Transcript_32955/g.78567  ORF Transcript_32955/g.78567 Transcript_32955/m.78567 type:complete len:200 (-) Transcript_32955:91-690(-)